MTATYVRGSTLTVDYTPGTAVSSGDVVVQADLIGVASVDIAANALGALQVNGEYDFDVTASSDAIAVGTGLYWDAAAEEPTITKSTNKTLGVLSKAYTADDTTMRVLLNHPFLQD